MNKNNTRHSLFSNLIKIIDQIKLKYIIIYNSMKFFTQKMNYK